MTATVIVGSASVSDQGEESIANRTVSDGGRLSERHHVRKAGTSNRFLQYSSSSGDVCQAILMLLCQGPKWGGFGAWEMMVDGRQVLGGRGCDCDDVLGKARARRVEQARWVRKLH